MISGGQIDTFAPYVRQRLDHWGDIFRLSHDVEYLGYQSKNMLQVLIEHKGEMPGRIQGYKPLEVDDMAMGIEEIVADIARTHISMACCLRGYYCGSGRRKVERFETANLLIANCSQRMVSVRHYLTLHELGFERVRGRLEGLSFAA